MNENEGDMESCSKRLLELAKEPPSSTASLILRFRFRELESRYGYKKAKPIENASRIVWLASYLWKECHWRDELKRRGVTWQKFVSIVSEHKEDIENWLSNKIRWDELIKNVVTSVDERLVQASK